MDAEEVPDGGAEVCESGVERSLGDNLIDNETNQMRPDDVRPVALADSPSGAVQFLNRLVKLVEPRPLDIELRGNLLAKNLKLLGNQSTLLRREGCVVRLLRRRQGEKIAVLLV